MTSYIKLATLEYPMYEGDIRLEHPEILESETFPNFPCPPTFAPVTVLPQPPYDFETHHVDLLPPQLIDGVWTVTWSEPRFLTDEELESIRFHRQLVIKNTSPVLDEIQGEIPNVIG